MHAPTEHDPDAARGVLVAHDLVRRFVLGEEVVAAVDGMSLWLPEGRIIALTGPSGSGKTTMLGLMAGWDDADAGTIAWRGDPVRPTDLAWDQVAVVPQQLGLLDELTVMENITLPLELSGGIDADGRARAEALCEALDITALVDRSPAGGSLGERQRVAVARALVRQPAALLVDEPTAHQDGHRAQLVIAAIRAACDEGTACLIASHDPDVLEAADEVITMDGGRRA